MKFIAQPVPISDLIQRIVRLEKLGFEYVERVTHQYHRACLLPEGGEGCFVMTDEFIASASDEEFETAIQEIEGHEDFTPLRPTASDQVH